MTVTGCGYFTCQACFNIMEETARMEFDDMRCSECRETFFPMRVPTWQDSGRPT